MFKAECFSVFDYDPDVDRIETPPQFTEVLDVSLTTVDGVTTAKLEPVSTSASSFVWRYHFELSEGARELLRSDFGFEDVAAIAEFEGDAHHGHGDQLDDDEHSEDAPHGVFKPEPLIETDFIL